jgi:hypothetical protein
MNETVRTLGLAAILVAVTFSWMALRTARIPPSSPERLISELRFMQTGSLLLVLVAGAYLGFAAAAAGRPGTGVDVMLAVGFLVTGAVVLTRDPPKGLTILALAFVAHALVDILHRPGLLPSDIAPRWYAVGCATLSVYLGALSYLPLLRR